MAPKSLHQSQSTIGVIKIQISLSELEMMNELTVSATSEDLCFLFDL